MIADKSTLIEDLSLKVIGHYDEIKQSILRKNSGDLERFQSHDRWSDIEVDADYSKLNGFIAIIQNVLRDNHDLLVIEETLERGIDQLAMGLVRKCPCPVWVIKRDSGDFRRILAAVNVGADYSEAKTLNQKIVELTHSLAQ